MKLTQRILTLILLGWAFTISAQSPNPKREFRGAWMHTVYQEQYAKQTTAQNKQYIIDQLDKMQAAGINAVLFQVRPSADAFYASKYEPWSRFLNPERKAPNPYWDPLGFIVDEAHKRGMELHAWLNPYRVTTSKTETLPKSHLYHKEPGRFIRYEGDGKIYFDPGQPKNRKLIVDVVEDIISNYDVDGIHFDDYFYPYPANGKKFADSQTYKKYGNGLSLGDWRRKNVDMLIEEIHTMISKSDKPWVRFGISPFGIWRNKKSDPRGSNTSGLQNYDDLYADVLLWAEKGWIDYLIPQIYWELDHSKASYLVLVDWWAEAVDPKCQLYIGQDVERTMKAPDIAPSKETNQLLHKIRLSRDHDNIDGNCWWPCYSVTNDYKGVANALKKQYHSTIAIVPTYTSISDEIPEPVKKLKREGNTLTWKEAKHNGRVTDHVKYVIYRFDTEEDIDFGDGSAIEAVTPECTYPIKRKGIYYVTALDHVNNESDPSDKITVR